MKVYDACMAYAELDMLELRFNILNDVVDYFVVVEAGMTHSGLPKPRTVGKALVSERRFARFADKIIYAYADRLEGDNAWERERNHRGLISGVLATCAQPEDWVIVGDADEIANPNAVQVMRESEYWTAAQLELEFYYYDFHHRVQQGWAIGACQWGIEQDANKIRTCQFENAKRVKIDNGGWHFSYFGDAEAIWRKVQSFMHHDWIDTYALTIDKVEAALDAGADLWGRSDLTIERVPLSDTLPAYVLANREQYAALGWLEREAVTT